MRYFLLVLYKECKCLGLSTSFLQITPSQDGLLHNKPQENSDLERTFVPPNTGLLAKRLPPSVIKLYSELIEKRVEAFKLQIGKSSS